MRDVPKSASFSSGKFYTRRRSRPGILKQPYGLRRREAPADYIFPECHEHDVKRPDVPVGGDIVPCDWVRTNNPNEFNEYSKELSQCKVPRCENCVQIEIYGPQSIWLKTAPPNTSPEEHRYLSRIRYLCTRCPFPCPAPIFGPEEMCSCTLRDEYGDPTDVWFQCIGCAESNWMDHDGRFKNPNGLDIPWRKCRKMNKEGVYVRPRGKRKLTRFRCVCGRWVSKKMDRSWCTWCHCPCV